MPSIRGVQRCAAQGVGGGDMAVLKREVPLVPRVRALRTRHLERGEQRSSDRSAAEGRLLYNFALFVEWPGRTVDANPFVIGVMGDANLEGALDQMKGRVVNGRTIAVQFSTRRTTCRGAGFSSSPRLTIR